jgi:pimeloyl-ACP methyl ester carboxylesterase
VPYVEVPTRTVNLGTVMIFRHSAALLALALLSATPAVAASSQASVFDQLQENVWYLRTTDKAARLYVTSIGKGAPVVFLHGGPGNDFNYFVDALMPHLAQNKFILFDQRGSLLSPVGDAKIPDLKLQQLVDDLEALRVATGQDKMVLLGHSFGSYLALSYYEQHPDHVRSLILTGAFNPSGKLMDAVHAMRARQQALQSRPAIAAQLKKEGLPDDASKDTPQQSEARWRITQFVPMNVIDMGKWRQAQGAEVYYNKDVDDAIGDSLPAELDIVPTLKAHPVPITVIQGDQDYVDPGAQMWKALAATADGKTVKVDVIPNATHYSWIDDPQDFSRALDEGLARVR